MPTHDLRTLSRQWFERVWNQRDLTAIDQMCHPHAVGHGLADATGAPMQMLDFLTFHARFTAALPDLKVHVEDVLVDGDKTATRYSFTATHLGEGLGVPASNKPVRVTGMTIVRWQDGKILESWNEFDKAGLAAQIAPGPH
jgi:steroid delta-isomerase-like uncharacterized protein